MNDGLITRDGNRVALQGVDVRAEIVAGHASAIVRQRYRNDETQAVESVYTFPLPTRAVLTGFSMEVAGRRIAGEVHERDEAFKRYDDALTAGHGGALLEQERPNVFTANVGNLLPGEETTIEIRYLEPLAADEGGVRWSIPTLVAPRYVPAGTADGARVTPPTGAAAYAITIEAVFDLGVLLDVTSPSHAITTSAAGTKVTARFAETAVALDRDVVLNATAKEDAAGPIAIASSVCHRAGGTGTFALTLVPDLARHGASGRRAARTDVVFLLDRSGSMGGSSMTEARTALRLCLRQLREGDRFTIVAFDNIVEHFAPELVPFTQKTLEAADAFLERVSARGGTELLEPMLAAARLAPDGLVVLLTDGQVANEDEILAGYLAVRKSARVVSFGIGTNVSDALLQGLADRTGGAVESIHPGERIDEKVVAQFGRATAARVTDVVIKLDGAEIGELAPATPRPIVDGEPYTVFGTYGGTGTALVTLRGKLDGEPFYVESTLFLDDATNRPVVEQLWAQARIRDLELTLVGDKLGDRRADAMRTRIIELAKKHGVSSRFTSFLVVEERTGDRRTNAPPETRVVPVSAPAGWSYPRARMPAAGMRTMAGSIAPARAIPAPRASAMGTVSMRRSMAHPAAGMPVAPAPAPAASRPMSEAVSPMRRPEDPVLAILGRQEASGLWSAPGVDALLHTAIVLLRLLDLGVTAAHATHGASLKKAVDAILAAPHSPGRDVALGVAWLVASGARTRRAIATAGGGIAGFAFDDDRSMRAAVDRRLP